MITVYFPIEIDCDVEQEVYKWVNEHRDTVELEGGTDILFKNEDDAILFKLKFGL